MEGIHVLDVAEDDLLFPLQCTGEDLRDKPRATFLETREREGGVRTHTTDVILVLLSRGVLLMLSLTVYVECRYIQWNLSIIQTPKEN